MNFKKTPARAIVMMAALFIFLFTQMADSFARYGGYRSSYRPSYSSYRSYSSFRSTSSFSSYRASRPYGMRPSSFSMSARNSFRVYPKSINSFSSISRTTKFTGSVTKSGYPIVADKSGRKFSVAQSGMLSGKSAANMAYQRTERTRYNVNGTINKAQTRIEKIARGKSGIDSVAKSINKSVDQSHLTELRDKGIKFTADKLIATGRTASGKVVFLEAGNTKAGLQHIVEAHGKDFASVGIPENKIPGVVMRAVTDGKIVGYQGSGNGRPIYETTVDGRVHRIAVTTSTNGFIVGANPAGGPK